MVIAVGRPGREFFKLCAIGHYPGDPSQDGPRTPAVVDTDVVSFLFKNDSRAQLYLPVLQHRKLLVSFMTEAELEQGIVLAKWGAGRIQRFHEFMKALRLCHRPAT